jgi:hypothetical protein
MRKKYHHVWAILFAMLIASMSACASRVENAWGSAYDANFAASYHSGWDNAGEGEIESARLHGVDEARADFRSATVWSLYYPLAVYSLTAGVVIGIVGQYAAVLHCRWKEEISDFTASLLIPGIRHSRAYSMLEMITQSKHQIRELQILRQIKAWQVATVKQIVTDKLRATGDIDAQAQANFLKRALRELDRIVEDGERLANSAAATSPQPTQTGKVDSTIAET